jgi:hypothetical protein
MVVGRAKHSQRGGRGGAAAAERGWAKGGRAAAARPEKPAGSPEGAGRLADRQTDRRTLACISSNTTAVPLRSTGSALARTHPGLGPEDG